jgi:hypothetical protein
VVWKEEAMTQRELVWIDRFWWSAWIATVAALLVA